MLVLAVCFAVSGRRRAEASAPAGPALYLNCAAECFPDYLRQELSYFDVVRDRHQAQHELLIAAQPAGNGGITYALTLLSNGSSGSEPTDLRRAPQVRAAPETKSSVTRASTRQVTRRPGQATADFRASLLDAALRLLYGALVDTKHEAAFRLTLPSRATEALGQLNDPWNYWVIMPELMGQGEGGSKFYSVEATIGATVRRITDRHKLRLRSAYSRALSSLTLEDGSRISSDVQGVDANLLYARSLGDHFTAGATATFNSSEFENLDAHVNFGPVFEANAFQYAQNASRQLRFVYQTGVWYNNYLERNSYGVRADVRLYHALSIVADVNQAWGSLQLATQLNSFIRQPSLFRLALGGQLSLSVVEGLSLMLEGRVAWINDQINQRQRSLEDSEIVLSTAEQPTSFTILGVVGVSYAFGSVHNTIVNPRFGRIDLAED